MFARTALLALAPGLLGAAVIAGGAGDIPSAPLATISSRQWQPRAGDVILTAADDLIGRQIRSASGERSLYSHVGLVVAHEGRLRVIESSPFGPGTVAFADIEPFTTDPKTTDLLVLRPRRVFDRERLEAEATRLAAAQVPFDYQFDTEDRSRLYCAELVEVLLSGAGVDLADLRQAPMWIPLAGEKRVIPPDAFAHASSLERVFARGPGSP